MFTALLAVIAGAGAVVAIWLPATDPPFPMALDGSVGHPLLRGPRVVPLDAADVRAPMGDAAAHGAPDVVASPDASKPDAGKPDAGKPDAGKPDAAKPARDAASAKRSRPRPTGRGYLSVDSRPWSRIYIDGRRVGITPLWRQRVSAGWRRVRLVSARRSASRRVRIRHGRHTNLGMINLR